MSESNERPEPVPKDKHGAEGDTISIHEESYSVQNTEAKDTVTSFFQLDDIKTSVALLSSSPYATYKKPSSNSHKIINILNVARSKKIIGLQNGSKDCVILKAYREMIALPEVKMLANVKDEFETAMKMFKAGQKQTSIKHFFKRLNPDSVNTRIVTPDQENNNSIVSQTGTQTSSKQHTSQRKEESVLHTLGLSDDEVKLIKTGLKIDEDLFRCKFVASKIRDFYSNEEILLEKTAWETKKSKFATSKNYVKTELDDCKELFKAVASLCDKEKGMQEAQNLSLEEAGPFLISRAKTANSEAKRGFLKLLSPKLKDNLRELNHYMRKRMSNIDRSYSSDTELKFSCFKAEFSWAECLVHLEETDWKPTLKKGNVKIEHFYSCCEFFRSAELRGDEYLDSEDLLDWLQVKESRRLVLNTLVENLPILMAKKVGRIALINVTTFLDSNSLIEDLMEASGKEKQNLFDDIEVTEGEVPHVPRKEGSGRIRIVDKNRDILEKAREYSLSAGIASHERRRQDVGRVGFVMADVQNFIKETCFKDCPEKAPCQKTIRRLYEPPSQKSNTKNRYKSDINARVGVKRNDMTASGEAHPHRHACFANFKISREFFSLFEEECTTISADDKAKIPNGIAAVHRLNSLSHKFFIESPNHPDHDVLRSGCLINPEGYMILKRGGPLEMNQTDVVSHEMHDTIIESSAEDTNLRQPILTDEMGIRSEVETEKDPSDFDDLLAEILTGIPAEADPNFHDAIMQFDGAEDGSSDDEFDYDLFPSAQLNKRPRLNSNEHDPNIDEDSEEESEQISTENSEAQGSNNSRTECQIPDLPDSRFVMKDGRKHVVTPHTGPVYVFFKGNKAKPASISGHANDILTMAKVEKTLEKPNLLLLLDDGLDWGGRGLQTLFYLGDLWLRLDLDLLVASRNAPGDSKWNPIEHYWGFLNKKISGLTLPPRRPDQSVEESEDESIKLLISSCLKDLEFDGHPVTNVHVLHNSSIVQIGEDLLENEYIEKEETLKVQKIMEDRKMDKKVIKREHPEIYEKLKTILKHVDIRLHGFVFRKCHPKEYNCGHCKKFPQRSSQQFWSCLPKKSSGGLFFDAEPDTNFPGHYRTLLDMLGDGDAIKVKPDGEYQIPYGRCQEKDCFVSFKTKTDKERHYRLAHENYNKQKNTPGGHVCTFKVNNVYCGQAFDTDWNLKKHKRIMDHVVRRKRGGKS